LPQGGIRDSGKSKPGRCRKRGITRGKNQNFNLQSRKKKKIKTAGKEIPSNAASTGRRSRAQKMIKGRVINLKDRDNA